MLPSSSRSEQIAADVIEPYLHRHAVQGREGQRGENLDPAPQAAIDLIEQGCAFGFVAVKFRRVRQRPGSRHYQFAKLRAGVSVQSITQYDDEVHARSIGTGEFIP